MSIVNEHLIEVYEATVVESDYPRSIGVVKHVARCLCGWSVCRGMPHATANQVAKHRKEVG